MKNKMISMLAPPPPPPLNKCLVEYRAFLQGAKKSILSILLATSLTVSITQCSSSSGGDAGPLPPFMVSTLAGSSSGYMDGALAAAKFNNPTGVAVDSSGNVYVADQLNNRIRKISR